MIKLWPIVGNPAAERLSCDPDVESQVAIRVGIGKRDDSERFPLEIKTLGFSSHKWERETKRSQQWNFPAESVDALEGLLARETRKEYTPRVAGLQVLHEFWQENLSAYHAIFREAIIWRTIYIHPGKQDDAQVFFWLILICCQVGIVPLAEEALEGHALQYLQSQWRCSESTAWEVWSRLLRHMVGNKDWTGQPKYIRRVVQDVRTREVKDRRLIFDNDPESRARQKTPNIDRERKGHLYSVYTVVEILTDGADGAWVPSYDTVYDWGNKGLFSWRQDQRKRKCLDEDGLNTVRSLVEAKREHQQLINEAVAVGMSHSAIKKAMQRGRLEAIIAQREADGECRLDDRAVLEDPRAALAWQLSQATTEDERLDVIDTLRRLDRMSERLGRPRRQE